MEKKKEIYEKVLKKLEDVIQNEEDDIAVLSTVVEALHNSFDYYDWTGFYRTTKPGVLKVGPYQGGHGCITIPYEKGVCGKTATEKKTQLWKNVHDCPYHIACASSTNSELVVPVVLKDGSCHSVIDLDSNQLNAFDETDQVYIEKLAGFLSERFSKK